MDCTKGGGAEKWRGREGKGRQELTLSLNPK
jgi:hypothetical protein